MEGPIYCDSLNQSKLTGDELSTEHGEDLRDTKDTSLRDSWIRQIIVRMAGLHRRAVIFKA